MQPNRDQNCQRPDRIGMLADLNDPQGARAADRVSLDDVSVQSKGKLRVRAR